MNRIGILVAIETESLFPQYGHMEKLDCPPGFELFLHKNEKRELYILHSGMGLVAAASGTQFLIDKYDVDLIVNFGVVGALTEEIKKLKTCVIHKVVHYRYDASEFLPLEVGQLPDHSVKILLNPELIDMALQIDKDLKPACCCSGDKFVATKEEKMKIHEQFKGDVCDMEAAAIALTCETNNVPVIILKAVSDSLGGGAEEFFKELNKAALKALQIADKIIENFVK